MSSEVVTVERRREHARIPCELKCWCETTFSTAYLKMSNISLGGCFLSTSIPFPPGETVSLAFETPADFRVSVEAEVVWNHTPFERHLTGPPGMGLRFKTFTRGEDEIRRWLAA